MNGGVVVMIGGVIVAGLGAFGLTRPRRPLRPWQPGDKVSLIELAASGLDPNFTPAGEQVWEKKLDRLIAWIGVAAGIALAAIGLWYVTN